MISWWVCAVMVSLYVECSRSAVWNLCNVAGVFFRHMSVMWNVCVPVLLVTLLIALSQHEVHWPLYIVRKNVQWFSLTKCGLLLNLTRNTAKFHYMIVCIINYVYSKKNITLLYVGKFHYMLVCTTEWLTMWNICRNTCIFILSYLPNFN